MTKAHLKMSISKVSTDQFGKTIVATGQRTPIQLNGHHILGSTVFCSKDWIGQPVAKQPTANQIREAENLQTVEQALERK